MIEEKDLSIGGVYRVLARNLIGPSVYAGDGIFYGIREKFGEKFTEREYLDAPRFRPYNTCRPLELVGMIPSDIEIRQSDPTVDRTTGRPVGFDRPVADGGKGWFFLDTGESNQAISPVGRTNQAFFLYLNSLVVPRQ